jgi:hypothetical protein
VDLPYELLEITASLAVDKEDNLDFVTFQDTFINPDQEHDSHVNRLLDRVKTWYVLRALLQICSSHYGFE